MHVNINSEKLQQIERSLNEISYQNAVENSSLYNKKLVIDRKTRLPFIDSQTGVAQRDCNLWMPKWQRMPGIEVGQLYTYPSKRWKNRHRGYLKDDKYFIQNFMCSSINGADTSKNESDLSEKQIQNNIRESCNREDEQVLLNGLVYEEHELNPNDSEESCSKRRKYRKRKKRHDQNDSEKPFACEICDMRYKTKAGLSYHSTYSHNEGPEDEGLNILKQNSQTESSKSISTSQSLTSDLKNLENINYKYFDKPANVQNETKEISCQ